MRPTLEHFRKLRGSGEKIAMLMCYDASFAALCDAVARGSKCALLLADLPFPSYQASPAQAYSNAARLLAAGAQAVKLEGGRIMAETVRFLVERGIPVCGHGGLTPQSVHQLGGYRVQGRSEDAARRLLEDARAIEEAGAAMLVLYDMLDISIPAARIRRYVEAVKAATFPGPSTPSDIAQVWQMTLPRACLSFWFSR